MSYIYTNENCLISFSSSRLAGAVKDRQLKAALLRCSLLCHKAVEILAEVGAQHWVLHTHFLAEQQGLHHYLLPLSFHLPHFHHSHPQHSIPVHLHLLHPRARRMSQDGIEAFWRGCVSGCSPMAGSSPRSFLVPALPSSLEHSAPPAPDPLDIWIIAALPMEVRGEMVFTKG